MSIPLDTCTNLVAEFVGPGEPEIRHTDIIDFTRKSFVNILRIYFFCFSDKCDRMGWHPNTIAKDANNMLEVSVCLEDYNIGSLEDYKHF